MSFGTNKHIVTYCNILYILSLGYSINYQVYGTCILHAEQWDTEILRWNGHVGPRNTHSLHVCVVNSNEILWKLNNKRFFRDIHIEWSYRCTDIQLHLYIYCVVQVLRFLYTYFAESTVSSFTCAVCKRDSLTSLFTFCRWSLLKHGKWHIRFTWRCWVIYTAHV